MNVHNKQISTEILSYWVYLIFFHHEQGMEAVFSASLNILNIRN